MFSENNPDTLKVKLDTMVKPENEVNKQDATDKLYSYLSQSSVQEKLSKDLSDELDTDLVVDKVYIGSVVIELRLKDFTELENIKSLSDTGVLSNIFGYLLLTDEYKSSCQADKVHIDAIVDDGSYQALMARAKGFKFFISFPSYWPTLSLCLCVCVFECMCVLDYVLCVYVCVFILCVGTYMCVLCEGTCVCVCVCVCVFVSLLLSCHMLYKIKT